jgi:hypothetical protein
VSFITSLDDEILLLFRILAPTTYIFFASAIPVISFGEQLERDTGIGHKLQKYVTSDLQKNIL